MEEVAACWRRTPWAQAEGAHSRRRGRSYRAAVQRDGRGCRREDERCSPVSQAQSGAEKMLMRRKLISALAAVQSTRLARSLATASATQTLSYHSRTADVIHRTHLPRLLLHQKVQARPRRDSIIHVSRLIINYHVTPPAYWDKLHLCKPVGPSKAEEKPFRSLFHTELAVQ